MNRLHELIAMVFVLSLSCPIGAQERFYDYYGNRKLATAVAEAVSQFNVGRSPRIAVLQWGDVNGGMPPSEKTNLLDANVRFVAELTKRAAGKFSVLDTEAIAHELKVRKSTGMDMAGVQFDDPKKVSLWLRDAFGGDIQFALLGRKKHCSAELLVVSLDGRSKTVAIEEDRTVLTPFEFAAGGPGNERMAIVPELLLRIKGEKEPQPLRLYLPKRSAAIAMIPDMLVPKLGTGDLTMEIVLHHTGHVPNQGTDGNKAYRIAPDATRLFAVAVSIDGQGTIAEEKLDYTGGRRTSYARLPPENLRKWVVALPGHVVQRTERGHTVNKSADALGHSRISIIGYQKNNQIAELFTLGNPSDGVAEASGINSSPGIIRITVYMERKANDRFLPDVMFGPDSGVQISPGSNVHHEVMPIIVNCYRTEIEEHVIMLRTSMQLDPMREQMKPYPIPVTR